MAFTSAELAALARLELYANSDFANDRHRDNFLPALYDMATASRAVGRESAAAKTAAATFAALPGDTQAIIDFINDGVPSALQRVVYVDQANGSDAANGLTTSTPIQSLGRAMTHHAVPFGLLTIVMLGDYTGDAARWILPTGGHVFVYPLGNAMRKLTLTVQPSSVSGGVQQYEVSGFYADNKAMYSSVQISGMRIEFPPQEQTHTLWFPRFNALFGSNGSVGPAQMGIELSGCEIDRPANGEGYVLGADTRTAALAVKSATITGTMAGRWAVGVPAGTATVDVPNITSNLITL